MGNYIKDHNINEGNSFESFVWEINDKFTLEKLCIISDSGLFLLIL